MAAPPFGGKGISLGLFSYGQLTNVCYNPNCADDDSGRRPSPTDGVATFDWFITNFNNPL